MFTVALLTIAKIWKQPKCPSTNEQIKKMFCIHTHTMKQYSAIKRVNFSICNNMDGLGGHYASEKKSEKTNAVFSLIYGIYKTKPNITKPKQTHRFAEQVCGYQRGRRWDMRKIGEEKRTQRSMKQNREPRNKPMHVLINL